MDNDFVVGHSDAPLEIRPQPTYRHLQQINDLVNDLGYTFLFSTKEYSLEDVQEKLRSEGPNAFSRYRRIQEDISPKAPLKKAKQLVAERLERIGPTGDLVIVDPYLFPPRPKLGVEGYADFLAGLIAPLLEPHAVVQCVVNSRPNEGLIELTKMRLEELVSGVALRECRTDDFHDRFWLADRNRGVVVGASMNGLGSKLFFIDELSIEDVTSIFKELAGLGV